MAEAGAELLRGRRVLVVEDEYMIAADLAQALIDGGVEVLGPAGTIEAALDLIARSERIDGAVLDVNIRGERVYPVADALKRRHIPFIFATGYDAWVIPDAYEGTPRHEKPVDIVTVARSLSGRIGAGG